MSFKGVNKVLNFPANFGLPGSTISFAGGRAAISITDHGSDWYWTVCAIMITASAAFLGLAAMKPRRERVFHYITASITMVAAIAYFTMASNLGWSPTSVEFLRSGNVAGANRQIFYVRYVDWVITTPLLLLDLLLTAGLPWPTIAFTLLVDEIMIVTGLVGALVPSTFKWGYYTFGCLALFYIGYVLIFEARKNANLIGSDVGKTFLMCGGWTFMLWTLYPIAWGLAEGGNVITSDSEAVFYGVLDVMAKPVFGALLIWGHRNIDPARLGIDIKDRASGAAPMAHEKSTNGHETTTAPVVSTGPATTVPPTATHETPQSTV